MPGGLADLDCDHLILAAFRVIRQEPLLLPRWQGRGAGARGGGGRWEGIGVAGAWGDRGESGSMDGLVKVRSRGVRGMGEVAAGWVGAHKFGSRTNCPC